MRPLIEIQSLSKTYERHGHPYVALHDVSLSIFDGDVFGIIGLSGAGKSTLLRCLASLTAPSGGRILVDGRDIAHLQGCELRRFRSSLGMVFQHFNLLSSRTVAKNVAYPLEIAGVKNVDTRVDELLHWVGLTQQKHLYPAQLSGGQKQRVGIARALATDPKVLYCDEATSSLDPKTTREILETLKNLHQRLGLTIVLITHQMEVIRQLCNRVAVLDHGRIVEQGPVAEIFGHPQHPTTNSLLQRSEHEIPEELLLPSSPCCRMVELHFRGKSAGSPLLSELVQRFKVTANILMGWLDRVQGGMVGTLTVQLLGEPENIQLALSYLREHGIYYKEVNGGS